jgi:hypothetical protein
MGAAMTIFHSNQNADVTEMNKFRKLYYRLSIAKDANAVKTSRLHGDRYETKHAGYPEIKNLQTQMMSITLVLS